MTLPDTPNTQRPPARFEISTLEAATRQNDEIDSEFFSFFEEEARQELSDIEQQLQLLPTQPVQALAELRRLFHTLQGSANSVGHCRFGALAHGMKERCDQAGKTQPTQSTLPQFFRLVLDVKRLMEKLIYEVRDPKCSPVEPEEVFRMAESIREFQFQPVRRARIHLP